MYIYQLKRKPYEREIWMGCVSSSQEADLRALDRQGARLNAKAIEVEAERIAADAEIAALQVRLPSMGAWVEVQWGLPDGDGLHYKGLFVCLVYSPNVTTKAR